MVRIPPPAAAVRPKIVFTALMMAVALLHGHFGFDVTSVWIGVCGALPWILPELRGVFTSVKIKGVGEFNFRELKELRNRVDVLQQVAKDGAGGKRSGKPKATVNLLATHLAAGESPDDEEETVRSVSSVTKHPDDPNKEMFGSEPERDGYRLEATVTPEPGFDGWYRIVAWVEKLQPGDVVEFHLHPSFGEDKSVVPVKADSSGRAELQRIAWGAFTLGAQLTAGGRVTRLELDLAELASAPAAFREQ